MTTTTTPLPRSPSRAERPPQRSPLASSSVRIHLIRGAVGLIAAVAAIALTSLFGPVTLTLLIVTGVAWRGCPTCWTVGLMGAIDDQRAREDCARCV